MIAEANQSQIAISGAASGIGLAVAHLLASRGASLSLADVNEAGLEAAMESLKHHETGAEHMYFVTDVRSRVAVDEWIQHTVDHYGKLDGAANMAGVHAGVAAIRDMTDDLWDDHMDVNARGVFFCVRAQLRAMRVGGSIVSDLPCTRLIKH